MVNDFSTFAQMPRPIFEIININKIIKGSISMTKLANKNINISSNLSDIKTISLKADPNQINQALNNLIKNSINAINEKKIDISAIKGNIYIEILTKNNFCSIRVKDNGIGLPEDKEHLTEPYISRSTKGSGLGLAIVKKIMEDHKGYLELENNSIKGGACVSLLFPLYNN